METQGLQNITLDTAKGMAKVFSMSKMVEKFLTCLHWSSSSTFTCPKSMDLLPPRGSNRVTQWQTSRVSQPKGSRDHPNDIARGTSDFVGADTAKGKPWNKSLCHSSHHGDFPTYQLSKKQVNPYQSPPAKKRRLKSNPCKSHMN